MVEKIKQQWLATDQGSIVYLPTGSGKTYIAIMMIKHLYGENPIVKELSKSEIAAKLIYRAKNPIRDPLNQKKVVFLVPTNNLVDQQSSVIEQFTDRIVGKYHGGQKNRKFYSELESWKREFDLNDVFVIIAKKFYDLLLHGYIHMDQINLLIFDECHHADQNHLYNKLMTDFFYQDFKPGQTKRPRILGLTASPIKQKVADSQLFEDEIESMMRNLCNNLYSQYVSLSNQEQAQIENDIKVEVKSYNANFQENLSFIKHFEQNLVLKILDLMSCSPQIIKKEGMYDQVVNPFLQQLQEVVLDEFAKEDDLQILNFLNGRKRMYDVDAQYVKENIDISTIQDPGDQNIIILTLSILKNVNNLILEIGLRAVAEFLKDMVSELLSNQNQSQTLNQQAVLSIINEYIQYVQVNQRLGNKTILLINELAASMAQNADMKTIVFVKDRSIAMYLSKILKEVFLEPQFQQQRIRFSVGVAMGFQGKGAVRKAISSTNTLNLDYKNLLQLNSQQVRMTHTEFKKNIDEFKNGTINILIATNVIEEGLDVTTCNQIISMNELMTVKDFIQIKGRARQANSRFVYICSKEEEMSVHSELSNFGQVITHMNSIAYREEEVVKPDEDIVQKKLKQQREFYKIKKTGAMVPMREAKLLLEQFCQITADFQKSKGDSVSDSQSKSSKLTDHTDSQSDSTASTEDSAKIRVSKFDLIKPIFDIKESVKDNNKYFFCGLRMPRSCKDYIQNVVKPQNAFTKKKDAENHVALIAIKALHEKKYINDYLYPTVSFQKPKKKPSSSQASKIHSQISLQDQKNLLKEQEEFNLQQKKNKSKMQLQVESEYKDQTLQPSQAQDNCIDSIIKIFSIKGKTREDRYPFKDSTDVLGVIFNSPFKPQCADFVVQQENRQKLKNHEHLRNLYEKGLITENEFKQKSQIDNDDLQYSISKENMIEINLNSQFTDEEQRVEYIEKLKFFHYWSIYFMQNAGSKFIKHLFENRFTFAQTLFGKEIKLLQTKFAVFIAKIYAPEVFVPQRAGDISQLNSFIVPLKISKYNQEGYKDTLNMEMIDTIIEHFKCELLTLPSYDQFSKTLDIYTTEDFTKCDTIEMISRVWSNQQNGLKHVIQETKLSSIIWRDKKLTFKLTKKRLLSSYDPQKSGIREKEVQSENLYTLPSHYFAKAGIFLKKKENKFIAQCRKERGYLEYCKTNADPQLIQKNESTVDKSLSNSTKFEVPEELLRLSPISYDMYQVLQQACSQVINFNEILQVNKFIQDVLKDMNCYKVDSPKANDVFVTSSSALLDLAGLVCSRSDLFSQMVEALTTPTADRDYNYERLEFMGDSIISFLVILELFLTKNFIYKEGDLDFYRISTISNMNFTKISLNYNFYKYIISEPQKVLVNFTPGGFDKVYYHTMIKDRNINELENKIVHLKIQHEYIWTNQEEDANMEDMYFMICNFLKRPDLRDMLFARVPSLELTINESVKQGLSKQKIGELLYQQNSITPKWLNLLVIESAITKNENLIKQAIERQKKYNQNYCQNEDVKVFQYKQLADVIESVAGAILNTSGLNATQNYLKKIGILKFDQNELSKQYGILKKKQLDKEIQIRQRFYNGMKLCNVEEQVKYTFKCKTWLLEALTHKSFNENQDPLELLEDYERLEYLGDAILNSTIADYFYNETRDKKKQFQPKQLHRMKAAVINNALLSLIVIENNLHSYILINEKAASFKQQFDFYVKHIQGLLLQQGQSTKQLFEQIKKQKQEQEKLKIHQNDMYSNYQPQNSTFHGSKQLPSMIPLEQASAQVAKLIDLDLLYENNLKIFGDVFESLVGAIFLDSQDIMVTRKVFLDLMEPYIGVYADLENMQEHKRTLLLELWSSKPYTKKIKIDHKSDYLEAADEYLYFAYIKDVEVLRISYKKDVKHKVRAFYKTFYKVIQLFLAALEAEYNERSGEITEDILLSKLKTFQQTAVFKEAVKSEELGDYDNSGL